MKQSANWVWRRPGKNRASAVVLLAMLSTGLMACGGGGGGSTDTTNPTAASTPTEQLVSDDTVITITYSESMDTNVGAWQLAGDLAAESDGGVWSMTAVQNDTLTVRPASVWFVNTNRKLVVDARDLAGNPAPTITLTYDIYRGQLYYVDGSMPDDNGNGLLPVTARKFIHTAVADATPPATVLVRAGDYRLSSQLGTQVMLKGGVSLYGGYNADFTQRNPAANTVTIEDRSNTGGTSIAPNRAVEGDNNFIPVSSDTIVDGFTIRGSTQTGAEENAAIALFNGAAPTIQNNIIDGGRGFNSVQQGRSYGIFNSSSSPTIRDNTIRGGSGYTFSYGILNLEGANPSIHNNSIHGGSGGRSYGITNVNSSPTIRNNIIHGGSGGNGAQGVFNSGGNPPPANPRIDNNIIVSRSGGGSVCIDESGPNPNPASLHNNDLWNCAVAYLDAAGGCTGNADGDNNAFTCALSEVNALTDIPEGVGGNISVDPLFADIDGVDNNINTMADNDWHFSATSPASVTRGGLNGRDQAPVWTFTTDREGRARPSSGLPWSIGAYEP
jgi:hypothetical protein